VGEGREGAAGYARSAGGLHPLLIFRRGEEGTYFQSMGGVPTGWTPEWNEVAKTELVACVAPVTRTKARDCPFRSGNVAELHDTTYDVSLLAAQTGAVVTQARLEVKAGECPTARTFKQPREIEDADYREAVVELVRPYVQP
jgi:hypothetical protein